MPSGPVPLIEAAKPEYSSEVLHAGVVETLIQESPLLLRLPFIPIQGNALRHQEEGTLPSVEFRGIGDTYSKSWGGDTEHFWGTTILGGEVEIDNYIINVRGNVASVKAKQYAKFAKAISRRFDKEFFQGTGTAKSFKGVKQLIAEGWGQTVSITSGNLTLDHLDNAIDQLRGMFSNASFFLRRDGVRHITNLCKTTSAGFPLMDITRDVLGRPVSSYGGYDLNIIGQDGDNADILPRTESENGGSATSVYLLGLSEDEGVCGLLGLGGRMEVRDFGEQQAKPAHLGRVEFYPGIAIFNRYAAVRISGVKY